MDTSRHTGSAVARPRLTPLLRIVVAIVALAAVAAASPVGRPQSNALWRIVHTLCVTDQKVRGEPVPCLEVNLRARYAVLKDLKGKTQVLLIPTRRISGIESPRLLAPGSPNYWQDAWDARRFFESRAGGAVPRDDVGMAINSVFGRSQNQLHIHIDCVRADVKAALKAHESEIGRHWAPFAVMLAQKRYLALKLGGEELGERDPFKILAGGDPEAGANMRSQGLAVIGAQFADGEPGFFLLAATGGTAENPDGASEGLLDHGCMVLSDAASQAVPATRP